MPELGFPGGDLPAKPDRSGLRARECVLAQRRSLRDAAVAMRFPTSLFPTLALLTVLCAPARLPAQEKAAPKDAPAGGLDSTPAAPAEQPPPALTEYKGRKIATTMHFAGAGWLIRADREKEENSALMLRELKIQPGWTVCDLGCGNGYHVLTMAETVGKDGKVLAVDIQKEMIDMLKARCADRGVKNVEPILGELHDPKLPAGSCDLILLVDVYHEFSHPEHMLAAMHRALKPGGQVALVEFRSEDPDVPIKPEHKMSKEQILKEWLPAGFQVAREFDGLPWQHLIFFSKAAPTTQKRESAPEKSPGDGAKP